MFFTLFYQLHSRNVFLNVYYGGFFSRPYNRMRPFSTFAIPFRINPPEHMPPATPVSPTRQPYGFRLRTRVAISLSARLYVCKSRKYFLSDCFFLYYFMLYFVTHTQKYRMFAYFQVSILRVLLPLLLFGGEAGRFMRGDSSVPFLYILLIHFPRKGKR